MYANRLTDWLTGHYENTLSTIHDLFIEMWNVFKLDSHDNKVILWFSPTRNNYILITVTFIHIFEIYVAVFRYFNPLTLALCCKN